MSLEALQLLALPTLACLVMAGILAYLGIHVLARGVVFVDIALAQISALGATVAFLAGYTLDGIAAYLVSLAFTLVGAVVFAASRALGQRASQEAVIGIVYAVAAATAVVLVDNAPHGAEHLKYIMVGTLLWVSGGQLAVMAALFAAVGVVHYLLRERFLRLSTEARHEVSLRNVGWDLLFYGTFGLVITSSVQVAGVLLVFSFLIVPAVFAALFVDSIKRRLLLSWALGFLVSVVGIAASFLADLPTGATIVATFGVALSLSLVVRALQGGTAATAGGQA